uniref:DDB1- and CUL4-associated factor 15 WD40 repeat-containing domain-containing protein n=1 Tax=Timema cristinae TaxID=61476 RepID=A0A7R9D4R8_TIMCR|nr:unnamed protein product [Timema cristinae]
MPEPALREQQFSLYLAVPSSSPPSSYVRMRPTVKHPFAGTVKRTVPYKDFFHVFLGLSKCGQFLLSYTYTADMDVVPFNTVYKYRLHWWTFVPHQKSRKVAEVMLFGNQGVYSTLLITVCQWPMDHTKVLVYGNCEIKPQMDWCSSFESYPGSTSQAERSYLTVTTVPFLNKCQDCIKVAASYEEEDVAATWDSCLRFSCLQHGLTVHTTFDVVSPYPNFESYPGSTSQAERSYLTVTTVPFLNKCQDCIKVAASYEEEDVAATWDSCLRFSCLQHGLTVHTTFDVVSPYPKFNPKISLKYEGAVVFNTGSLLYILKIDLEHINKKQHTSSVTFLSKFEEASSANCLKNLESLTIREKAVKNFCQDVFSGRITRSLAMRISTEAHSLTEDCTSGNLNDDPVLMAGGQTRLSDDCPNKTQNNSVDSSQELNITCGIKENVDNSLEILPSPNSLLIVNPSSVESEGVDSQTVFSSKRRELGCATPPRIRRTRSGNLPGKFGGSLLVSAPTPAAGTRQRNKMAAEAEKAYEFTEDVLETSCEKLSSFRRRRLADKKYEFCEEEGEDAENIVPYRLHRRRESPPRLCSPTRHYSPSPLISLRRKLHDEPLDLLISPRSPNSPYSEIHPPYLETDKVLRPLNRNTASAILLSPRDRDASSDWPTKAISKKLSVLENVVLPEHEGWDSSVPHVPALLKTVKKEISNPNTQTNSGNDLAKCTVEFKRRFIEVDDELVSVITDIEDDDLSEITGYHSALPLEVHGAGYMQLQMISNSKAEKLMAPCVLVQQRSFDVEKFCHEVAEWLCEESGKKYWFCNDYDVEIVDVCPFSGDVIALAVMRIQATIKTQGAGQESKRKQYQGGCKFVWNIVTGKHSVVEVDPLTEFGSLEDCEPWNPARGMAKNFHENLPQIPMCQSVRFITNQLVLKGVTLEYLSDMENMIGLVLEGEHQNRL